MDAVRQQLPPATAAALHIIVALIFATAIILASLALGDSPWADRVTIGLIALYCIPYGFLCIPTRVASDR